jgi:hypothetical protein
MEQIPPADHPCARDYLGLDGLEVTLMAAITGVLQETETLHFTAEKLGLIGSAYLIGRSPER